MPTKLTLVRSGDTLAPVATLRQPAEPARIPAPATDPVRDAAIEATADPDVIIAMDDAIQTVLERLHRDNGATPLAGLLTDVWRTAFATGYQIAHTDQAHAAFAEDTLATVIEIEKRDRAELRDTERALGKKAVRP